MALPYGSPTAIPRTLLTITFGFSVLFFHAWLLDPADLGLRIKGECDLEYKFPQRYSLSLSISVLKEVVFNEKWSLHT